MFYDMVGNTDFDKVLCRGIGRRKGLGWVFNSHTLNGKPLHDFEFSNFL